MKFEQEPLTERERKNEEAGLWCLLVQGTQPLSC